MDAVAATFLREAADRLSVLARARHPAALALARPAGLAGNERARTQGPAACHRHAAVGPRSGSTRWRRHAWRRCKRRSTAAAGARCASHARRVRFYVSGVVVFDKIYLDEAAGRLVEAYWRWLLLSGPAAEAERFAADLRRPPAPSDAPAAAQFIERVAALAEEVAAIEADERALNEVLYELYGLSPEERNLVENELGRRNVARRPGDSSARIRIRSRAWISFHSFAPNQRSGAASVRSGLYSQKPQPASAACA